MDIARLANVGNKTRVLVAGLHICALSRQIGDTLPMLTLVARDHVYRLLQQVEVEVLVRKRWSKVEVSLGPARSPPAHLRAGGGRPVYKGLAAGIKQCVDIRLIPASLFDRLKLTISFCYFYDPFGRGNLFGFPSICCHIVQTVACLSASLTQSFTVLSLPPCCPIRSSKSIRESLYNP